MQRKHALDPLTVRDPAHRESFVESATLTPNDYAGEYLDSFLVPFHNTGVNAHAISDGKWCHVAFVLFLLNGIDDLIHGKYPLPARSDGQLVSSRISEIATARRII